MNSVSIFVDPGSTHHLVNRETGKFIEKVEDVDFIIPVAEKGKAIVAKRCGNLDTICLLHVNLKNVDELMSANVITLRSINRVFWLIW